MWKARWVAVVATAVVLLSGAAVASADTTTIGETVLTPNAANLDDLGQNVPVFQGDSSGNYVLSSPQSGTLTSWSFLSAGAPTGDEYALRILRPSGQSWTAIATSAVVGVTTAQGVDAVNGPFPTSLAIAAGDRIALQAVGVDTNDPIESGTQGTDGVRYFSAPFADGTTAPLAPDATADNGQVVPIQATVTYNAPPPVRTLTVSLAGTGTGTVTSTTDPTINCPGTCSGQYANGTAISLTATPAAHSQFTGWSGACTNATGPCALTLGADAAVTATFAPAGPPPVNVTAPAIGGTPKDNQTIYCNVGTWTTSSPTTYTETWYENQFSPLLRQNIAHQVATGFAYTVGDLQPGDTLFCTVTATDSHGGVGTANSATEVMQATVPVISPFHLGIGIGFTSFPTITVTSTIGAVNGCSQGTWLHFPSKYVYRWYSLPMSNSSIGAGRLVGTGKLLPLTGDLQAGYLVCQVSATNAAGTATALSNRYLVAQPDLGFHVNAIEITQGIQTPELPTRNAGNPFNENVSYQGVPLPEQQPGGGPVTVFLAAYHATVVRVYANSQTPLGSNGVPTMTLTAYRFGHAIGTIPPDQIPPAAALPQGGLGQVNPAQRANPSGAYTFTLPQDWTDGDGDGNITLKAQIAPGLSNRFLVIPCNACAAERTLTLGPEHFNRVQPIPIVPLAIQVGSTLPPDPDPAWSEVQAVTPYLLQIPPYQGILDGSWVSATSITVTTCRFLQGCNSVTTPNTAKAPLFPFYQLQNEQLLKELIDAEGSDNDSSSYPYALSPANPNYSGGVSAGPPRVINGSSGPPLSLASDDRPITGIAHELNHGIGRVHAGQSCGSNSNNQVGEPWPPVTTTTTPATATTPATTTTSDGNLDGFVLDTNTPSPYALRAPAGQFDLMSYCTGGADSLGWISVLNWNRAVMFRAITARTFARRQSARAAAVRLRAHTAASPADPPATMAQVRSYLVHALYDPQTQTTTVLDLTPDAGAPTPANPSSGFTFTARDGQGNVTGTAGTSETLVHIEHGEQPMLVSGKVPADQLHEIDLMSGHSELAKDTASAHAPTVSISKSLSGQTLGGGGAAVLRWTAHDADHNPLTAAVDYSPDGGHSWHVIYRGENRASLPLPTRLLSRSANARFRVTVSDGFNAAMATSPRFRALGAPPTITIVSPRARTRISAGGALNLEASAYADTGRRLTGRSLVWSTGRRRLGTGVQLTVLSLAAGRHVITVRATGDGTASRSMTVTVMPTAPIVTRLTTPKQVSKRARTVTVSIATMTPATLTAGAQHFATGPRARTIKLTIRRGSSPLGIVLTLRSGRYRLRVPFRVTR